MAFFIFTYMVPYIFAPIFLMATIKIRRIEKSPATFLLLAGFTILTVLTVSNFAEYFEVLVINYSSIDEYTNLSGTTRWQAWEKWYYWGQRYLGCAAYFLIGLGFILEGKRLLHSLREAYSPS